MKPITAVAFAPGVPFEPFLRIYGTLKRNPDTWVLNCTDVLDSNYGFLQLVPKPLEGESRSLTLFVPASRVLWMLKADSENQLGFLAGLQQEAPQSDPTA